MSGNQPFPQPGREKAGKPTPVSPPDTCRVRRNTCTGRGKSITMMASSQHLESNPSISHHAGQPDTNVNTTASTCCRGIRIAGQYWQIWPDILRPLRRKRCFRHTVLMAASLPHACRDPETTMYSFQGNYWNGDRKKIWPTGKNTSYLSVTDCPLEDDNLCICW